MLTSKALNLLHWRPGPRRPAGRNGLHDMIILAAMFTAAAGPIGFVALVAPQIIRRLLPGGRGAAARPDHRHRRPERLRGIDAAARGLARLMNPRGARVAHVDR